MPYYAHTAAGKSEGEWEPLRHHLTEVAAFAADRADRFGAAEIAHATGLLHDLGKYSCAFQDRLRGNSGRVDHSTAGAAWAKQHLDQKWGPLIAHAVAGHHAGLADGLFDPEGRLEEKADLAAPAAAAAKADGVILPQDVSQTQGMRFLEGQRGFQCAFLTRMIFSCLIDADRTAAAAFEARATGTGDAEPTVLPTVAELDDRLRAKLAARAPAASPLNRMRDQVLRAALSKAANLQGAFTLTVPTGGGKTLTSLAFALAHARAHGLDRVIVVIPYTSIIEQTAAVYRDILGDDAVLEHHSAFAIEDEARWSRDRTGPDRLRLSMERWNAPIVVTTAVQFFESLFSDRPSRCRKLHSIARSVVVVDEAQTMPLPLLRPCVAGLKELARNYKTSVVLCTATQPALTAGPKGSESGFSGGFIKPTELVLGDMPNLFTVLRRVTLRRIGQQTNDDLATRMAEIPQALCIVNQRGHARALFQAITHLPGARHLSTCMHSVHRKRVLAEIRDDLLHQRPCRVVSTSLIEAGVDVDFPLVLRAEAGLDQIAQAAGRCNREFRRTPEESAVLVFSAPDYKVLQTLKANTEAASEIMNCHKGDLFAPAAMTAFFELLYWRKGAAELDRGRVVALCEEHAAKLNFPFAEIAQAMRFIDDATVPVIVPLEDEGAVTLLLEELKWMKTPGSLARRLGRYTVGVPRRVRNTMLAQHVADVIRSDDFGDQFVVLTNLNLYRTETGLFWNDLTFMDAERLIL
jgi:CRISPR-associated endonuclease/helicase Cas3